MIDVLLIGILLAVFGLTGFAIYKSKKSGKKCMGCPDSCACPQSNCTGGCSSCGK